MRAVRSLAIVALLVLTPFAAACEPTTSSPEVTSGDMYVDVDCTMGIPGCELVCALVPLAPGCVIWVYQESNDIEGLQRNDENRDDTCGGMIEGDTLVH